MGQIIIGGGKYSKISRRFDWFWTELNSK